jgi:hypothetical protein
MTFGTNSVKRIRSFEDSSSAAANVVQEHWAAVDAGARRLLQRGSLTHSQLVGVIQSTRS